MIFLASNLPLIVSVAPAIFRALSDCCRCLHRNEFIIIGYNA